MKKQKSTHKPFTKPFWKLLGTSLLGLTLVYGGIVWAFAGDPCFEYNNRSTTEVGSNISNLSGWTTVRKICNRAFGSTVNGVAVSVETSVNIDGAGINNKTLKITNNSGKDYFVPLKTKLERDSFLAAKGRLNVTACEVGLKDRLGSDFQNAVQGCEPTKNCQSSCLGSWTTGGTGSCSGTYDDYFPGDTCSGTYDVIERKDPWGNAFDWSNNTKYFMDGSGNSLSTSSIAHSGLGDLGYTVDIGAGGTYVSSGTCEAYYVNGSNQWVSDSYGSNYDQFDSWCEYQSGPYITGGVVSGAFGYVTISTNNSCASVPLNQCATNQYYSGCTLNDSTTPTSCTGVPQSNCGSQDYDGCTWSGSNYQTHYCNVNATESSCDQAGQACNWEEHQDCLDTNICLNPNTTQTECQNVQACVWSAANQNCQLDSQACSGQDTDTQVGCENNQGCFWFQNQYCTDDTQECYGNNTESVCNNAQNCYWDGYCRGDF